MKPAAVINRGSNFVTLRATTDRPAEIREALAARDVQEVFKGDQNQAWDAVLANHCLARAVGDSGADITFFIQDERLGTGDARLARQWRRDGRQYVLTEDYYRGRTGAVWEHQDASYGLFFTEAVSPEQFAAASVHLHRAASLWARHSAGVLEDRKYLAALSTLGVTLPGASAADSGTRLGPAVDAETLAEYCSEHPAAALYYALTKTDGLYGIAPVENANITLSSIHARDGELPDLGRRLLLLSARGAMRLAGTTAHRRGVKLRARRLAGFATGFLQSAPDASVADFQEALGHWLTGEIFPADRVRLERASRLTRVDDSVSAVRSPEETLHFFFDLALRHPGEFAGAYNEALNRAGLGLQRVRYDAETGEFTPPFFVELAPGGRGAPVYRYGVELSGRGRTSITLLNATAGDIVVEAREPIRCAEDFVEALLSGLDCREGLAIIGKAATFAAELQRAPRGLGLPRQGSKYAPMVDHLLGGLRERGVLRRPTGLLIRIGLNALDRLSAMSELPLRPPRFLREAMGTRTTCRAVAESWRQVAAEARALLELLACFEVGQHVHVARVMSLNARGADWESAASPRGRLLKLERQAAHCPQGPDRLRTLGRDLPPAASAEIERLLQCREELLVARRAEAAAATAAQMSGRVVPDAESRRAIEDERGAVECRLLVIVAAYVRRLCQRAESLAYVNDRPYTLALYLLFGIDIFPAICREVEFDIEYVSLCGDFAAAPECECGLDAVSA